MKKIKRLLSCIVAAAVVFSSLPVMIAGSSAVGSEDSSVAADASLVINRPMASVVVTDVTRVAYGKYSMKAPSGSNSVIVKSTPSGIPEMQGPYIRHAYAGETPTATTVTFTAGVELEKLPKISCNNTTVTFSSCAYASGTYTWTVTGGTADVESTLMFDIEYEYKDVNAVTGKTYSNTYHSYGTSFVEAIASPAGVYSTKRTYAEYGFGQDTQNRSYIASYILGANTYGSLYNNGTGDGSVDFTATTDWGSGEGWNAGFGVMKKISGSDSNRQFNVSYQPDANRPLTTVYFDRSIYSTLSDLNLRVQTSLLTTASNVGERCTVYLAGKFAVPGIVQSFSANNVEEEPATNSSSMRELGLTDFTGSVSNPGDNFLIYMTGLGANGKLGTTDYTLSLRYRTEGGWNGVYVGHSHSLSIVTYDKGELRNLVEEIQGSDPTVMSVNIPEGDYKGYNPQSWYYASGWEAFFNAYNTAKACLNRPDVTQTYINTMRDELLAAYNDLQLKTADYSYARIYYNQAISKNPNHYTLASWAGVQNILDKYKADISVIYQPAVDKLAIDLKAAVEALEEKTADYTDFFANLNTVNLLMSRSLELYGIPASAAYTNWSELVSVLKKSGCVYNELDGYAVENYLPISRQSTVDGYTQLLVNAINNLKLKTADYTAALEAEREYGRINLSQLVSESAAKLKEAYNALAALHNLDASRQADVDAATAALNAALDNIEYKPADTSAALQALARADAIDRDIYGDLTAVDKAADLLRSKLSLDIRRQAEVDRAVTALNSAIDKLTANLADYIKVDEAMDRVNDLESEILTIYETTYGFTAATFYSNWSAVQKAVNDVVRGLDATKQKTVDGYAEAIYSALAALTEKDADYSAVIAKQTQAVELVSNGAGLYTSESLDRLTNAYMSVVLGHKLSKQATVDGYADAIQQAIDSLEYLKADYGSVQVQLAAAQEKFDLNSAYSAQHPGYSYYTEETIAELDVAIASVKDGLDIRYQSTVNGYAVELENAINNLKFAPADYSQVDMAVSAIPADLSNYTTLSVATLTATVNSVNRTLTADKQTAVDRYVATINNAVKALELKPADYRAVTAAINSAPKDPSLYTPESWQYLQDKINEVDYTLDITRQSTVDTYAEAINTAIEILKYLNANYSAVDAAIEAAQAKIDTGKYTEESVSAFRTVVSGLDRDLDITQQDKVDAMVSVINRAADALELKPADYSAVDLAVQKAQEKINTGNYTDASVAVLNAAIEKVVRGLNIERQEEVNAFAAEINTAIGALAFKGADYTAVNTVITAAQAKIDSGKYTDDSVNAVTKLINSVDRTLNIDRQEEVNAYAAAISKAAAEMILKGADYSAVDTAIEAAQAKIDSGKYTDDSVNAVTELINAVDRTLDIEHQEEVNAYAAAISKAAAEMILKGADYSAVDTAIEAAQAKIDSGKYTDDSVNAVTELINSVDRTLGSDRQEEVNAYAAAISEAAAEMVLKGADYTELDKAVAEAQAKIRTGKYTTASIRNLTAVLDSIDKTLDIEHQEQVDAYVTAVREAIGQLVFRGATYTAVDAAILAAQAKINSGKYTDASIAPVLEAINAVDRTLNVEQQATVDGYAKAINEAANAMVLKGADYTELVKAVEAAEAKIAAGNYTDDSVAELREAIDGIEYGLDIENQDYIDDYVKVILELTEALVLNGADYTAVNTAIEAAQAKINSGKYTDASIAPVLEAINAVDRTLDAEHQTTVDGFAKAINDASNAMVLKDADYTELDKAIKAAEEKIAAGWYTDESVAAVREQIDLVERNLDIEHQSQVDMYTEAIVKLTNEMDLKLANYTELQKILDLLDNSSSEIYTNTYSNFDEVMVLVSAYRSETVEPNMNLPIYRQDEVDLMTATLRSYIDMLEPAVIFRAKEGSTTVIKNGYIYGLQTKLTKKTFESDYVSMANVTVTYSGSGSAFYLGTGTVVTVTSDITHEVVAEYQIVIYGDVDGDCQVGSKDITAIKLSLSGGAAPLSGAKKKAGNINGDLFTNTKDIAELSDVLGGKKVLSQVTGTVS